MKAPNGSAAVMASKVRGEVAADTPERALHRKLEYFPTPPWAARAGAELVRRLDPTARVAWEPACGQGHMAEPLREVFPEVQASDIHDHGYARQFAVFDFLTNEAFVGAVDWVITNPPFGTAAEFVRLGLQRARRGVAILCRTQWLESAGRYDLFYGGEPLSVLAPFVERVSMNLGVWDPKAGLATSYAWFIWIKPEALPTAAMAVPAISACTPIILPIGPGTKARLTHADDARRFGAKADAPLFEGRADG